jgi:pyruvate formate lyase activating enzyme
MITCLQCGKHPAGASFALCAECLRKYPDEEKIIQLHKSGREKLGLPPVPPKSPDGAACTLCANNCRPGIGQKGYCGVRVNYNGKIKDRAPAGSAFLHMYLDRLPTNCCAAWFCGGSNEQGSNLAVFMYGCNFDCLFCQNSSHKYIEDAPVVKEEELVKKALDPRVRCVCFFGGSPEPQFPFVVRAAEKIHVESGGTKHICWEWNGCGNRKYLRKAVALSKESAGTVKFDLKAFDRKISYALCGVDNRKAYENFRFMAELYPSGITATTLLVPYYIDKREVEAIARFISEIDAGIHYSLLVFHPDYYLDDFPITPKEQVYECYDIASSYLDNVTIGNRGLLY